jgi:hypothetical protein
MSTEERTNPAATPESATQDAKPNELAHRMSRLVKQAKTTSPRRYFLYAVVGVLLVAVIFYWDRSRQAAAMARVDQWIRLDQGTSASLRELISKRSAATSPQGKAARLQVAWNEYWNDAIRLLGVNPKEAVAKLNRAEVEYRTIAEESKNDPFFLPEALYALAAIEETRTIENPKKLESARDLYKELATKHKDTAYGQLAQKRYEMLEDANKFDETQRFYTQLARSRFMPDFAPPPGP